MTHVVFLEQKGDEEAADQEDAVPSTSKPSAKETRNRQTGGYITCIPRPFVTVRGNTIGERDRK